MDNTNTVSYFAKISAHLAIDRAATDATVAFNTFSEAKAKCDEWLTKFGLTTLRYCIVEERPKIAGDLQLVYDAIRTRQMAKEGLNFGKINQRTVSVDADGRVEEDIHIVVSADTIREMGEHGDYSLDLSDVKAELRELVTEEYRVTQTFTVSVSKCYEASSAEEAIEMAEDEGDYGLNCEAQHNWELEDMSLEDTDADVW